MKKMFVNKVLAVNREPYFVFIWYKIGYISKTLQFSRHPSQCSDNTVYLCNRRVRGVFDVAVNVHKTVQQRDIEVGRNLGNWILRHLDRMKPTAEIRSSTCRIPTTTATTTTNNNKSSILKRVTSFPLRYQKPIFKTTETETKSRLLFTPLSIRPKSFPYLTSVMQQMRTPATNTQQFRLVSSQSTSVPISNTRMSRFGCVFRPDISQWMMLA